MAWRSTPFVPRTDAERQAHALEHGALLDVQFEIGGGVFLLARGFGKAIDFHAAAAQGVFQTYAIAIGACAVGGDAGGACEG